MWPLLFPTRLVPGLPSGQIGADHRDAGARRDGLGGVARLPDRLVVDQPRIAGVIDLAVEIVESARAERIAQRGAADHRAKLNNRVDAAVTRSEERRVGKECVSTCRSRWSPDH